MAGLVPVAGGFSISIGAGSVKLPNGSRKRLQFRLKIAIAESYGSAPVRKALATARLVDLMAMRTALVEVKRGAEAEYLMRIAGEVAEDEEKFSFAIASARVVMSRPSEKKSEAAERFTTWGQLARAWCGQELARLYPNAGYAKKTAEDTDEPRVEFIAKYIGDVPLATFNDDDYWRAMRPARARCKTDSTFKQYAQVARRVLKIAVELRIIAGWPLSAVCKLPKIPKGAAPEFPFLYPEEYVRLMRCAAIPLRHRVLWGFIIREGLRIGEAFRIRWEHLTQLENGRWLLDVPDTKTGRALNFVLNIGTGEVLAALRERMPGEPGPFAWLKATNLKKAAEQLRAHVELSGTTRDRLLLTDGRLRRLREHDLRSTYVTWCKLAGIDNETISMHTGHESNAMIGRYNRSKATIEHLGLAPYLPLDAAFGERALAELEPAALGAGAPDACDGMPPPSWAEVLVTAPLALPAGPGHAQLTGGAVEAEGAPLEAWREAGAPEGAAARASDGRGAQGALAEPVSPADGFAEASPRNGSRSSNGSAPAIGERNPKPLNGWSGCDASRDGGSDAGCMPMPANEKSSMFDAVRETGVEPALPFENWNLNSVPSSGHAQKTRKPGGGGVPEATGSPLASHPGVTLLEQLQASARAALAERNWAVLQALQPLIDAAAPPPPAAPPSPPAPVKLEVVRAQRKGGQ